jgi:tetratricopeptide (TPR) repeat protein
VGGENIRGLGLGRLSPNVNGPGTGLATGPLNGYLTGNVKLDDGTPPPEPVSIERVCDGARRKLGYTDRKGRFSFQIASTVGAMQEANQDALGLPGTARSAAGSEFGVARDQQLSGRPGTQLGNCELRAVLAGFRSGTVALEMRHITAEPNVGTMVLHRLADVEGTAISLTSLQAPKEARRAYDKALEDLKKNKLPEAAKQIRKAVDIYPNYAAAWYELGRIQEREQDIAAARKSFTAAMAADAKFVRPYLKLAELDAKAQNLAELADTTNKLLRLDAVDYPMTYFYNAAANLSLGQLDEAEKSARAGEKLDTSHQCPGLERMLALILARKKDYPGAADQLRSYLALAPDAADAGHVKQELAELDRLAGANEQAKK